MKEVPMTGLLRTYLDPGPRLAGLPVLQVGHHGRIEQRRTEKADGICANGDKGEMSFHLSVSVSHG